MLLRLVRFGITIYTRSPARSWLITSVITVLYRMVNRSVGRSELIDVSSIKPGETIVIQHLPVTHKEQLKEEKRSRRREKKRSKAKAAKSSGAESA